MHRHGTHLLSAARGERAEPVVTYTRIATGMASFDDGERIEPRVATPPAGRPVHGEDNDALPHVEAPPSQTLIDDLAAVVAPLAAGRKARKPRRASRLLALAGVLAAIGGAGVLAATYIGVVSLDARVMQTPPGDVAATGTIDPDGSAAGSIRVVPLSMERVAVPDNTGLLEPPVLAGDEPGRVIADPPLPRLRPATASFNPPQPPDQSDEAAAAPAEPAAVGDGALTTAAALNANANTGVGASATATSGPGADVDGLMASVDRILAEERARTASAATPVTTTTVPGALPYPVLEPLPGATSAGTALYPPAATGAYPAADSSLYTGANLAADGAPAPGPLLPKRRVFLVPNAPVPPADIPNTQPNYWGPWGQ